MPTSIAMLKYIYSFEQEYIAKEGEGEYRTAHIVRVTVVRMVHDL